MNRSDAGGRAGAVITTAGLSKSFRGFTAVDNVDLAIAEGDVHALVGPNGAGKTTLFNLLTGFLKPTGGQIRLGGQEVTGSSPERIARLGVARSFQITNLFEQLTLQQHVELALLSTTKLSHRFWVSDRVLTRFHDRAGDLLDQVGLITHRDVPAGTLAYGQKRALELALALALDPAVLLLDEPTAGMGLEDVERTVELIRRIRADRTVVLVEHNMSVVAGLADRVTVLQFGRILTEGTYDEVRNDSRVIEAYLGGESAA
ncbi:MULTISPECIES: ABC transporter ATP-binding protein [unclassified Kribbella]|uniref:ABC transporter ATP-binding protein n=1 Tax=unclassified Kribbella TaxID=2644121 RepID=UPI0033E8BAE6